MLYIYIYIKIQSHEISQNNIMARKIGGHGKKKRKKERKGNRKEKKKKNEVSDTYRSFDDDSKFH